MAKNINLDIIRLSTGHALIMGNIPDKVKLDMLNKLIAENPTADVASFGLFESATPNYTTYYPDVSAEDLVPKESDYITPIFRALSQVIVHKRWNPIDFGKNDVLRPSMKLLQGQTVYVDHETAVGNALGSVMDVAWQDEYTAAGGKVPAGINAQLKIDGKSNPRIARNIQMDPPAIHSTSVTVEFEYEQSHPKMDRNEFFNKLGQYDDKGQMIRRVVTKVRRYHEISLVGHGADPYAQKIVKDGKINNPKYAHISYNSAEEKEKGGQVFFFDFKNIGTPEEGDIISNSDTPTIPNNSNKDENTADMKKFLADLTASLGLTELSFEDAPSEEQQTQILDAVKALTEGNGDDGEENSEVLAELQQKYDALVAESSNIIELKKFRDDAIKSLRDEVSGLYALVSNNNPKESIQSRINGANYDALIILKEQYSAQLEEATPLTCQDCQSHNVSRASASVTTPESGSGKKVKTPEEVRNALRKPKKFLPSLHGAD